jgi:hypothetical protein
LVNGSLTTANSKNDTTKIIGNKSKKADFSLLAVNPISLTITFNIFRSSICLSTGLRSPTK